MSINRRGPKAGKPRANHLHLVDGKSTPSGGQSWGHPPMKRATVVDDPEASKLWDKIIAEDSEGILISADEALLTLHVEAWSMYLMAAAEIAARGQVIEEPITANGVVVGMKRKVNPALRIMASAHEFFLKTGARLRLAPLHRGRKGNKRPGPSHFDGLLG